MTKAVALLLFFFTGLLQAQSLSKALLSSCDVPQAPEELTKGVHKLPDDVRLASVISAEGTQNHQCVEMHDGDKVVFVWKFLVRVANLYRMENGKKVFTGKHFANPYPNVRGEVVPAWNFTDGSFYIGDKAKKTPAPVEKEKNVPWLTLEKYHPSDEAQKHLGKIGAIPGGSLSKVSNIQRADTVGGQVRPTDLCNKESANNKVKIEVPYSANYYLYVNKFESPLPKECKNTEGTATGAPSTDGTPNPKSSSGAGLGTAAASGDLLIPKYSSDPAVIQCCGTSTNCLEVLTRKGDTQSAACLAIIGTGSNFGSFPSTEEQCPVPEPGPHLTSGNLLGAPISAPTSGPFEKIRDEFCGADPYTALCGNANTISPTADFEKNLKEIKDSAKAYAGPRPKSDSKTGNFNSDEINWLNKIEVGVFTAQTVKQSGPKGLPLNEKDLQSFFDQAKGAVIGNLQSVLSRQSGSDKARADRDLNNVKYLPHWAVSNAYLQSKAKDAFSEFREGVETCGVDGLESNAYKADGNVTLCSGAWAAVLATFREGNDPIPENLIKLGVLGKLAHETSHSVDSPGSNYKEYNDCIGRRYPNDVGSDRESQKEIFADRNGAQVLGNALTDPEVLVTQPVIISGGTYVAPEIITIKNKMKILYSNYRELCSKSDKKIIPEFKARFKEISGNASIRKGLGCTPPESPADYCKL